MEEGFVNEIKKIQKRRSYEYIQLKGRRNVTFSKRKKGLINKAQALNILTGSKIALLIVSPSGKSFMYKSDPNEKIFICENQGEEEKRGEEENENEIKEN